MIFTFKIRIATGADATYEAVIEDLFHRRDQNPKLESRRKNN